MRHVARLGGADDSLSVGADAHALRLDANRHLADRRAARHIDQSDRVVILIGGIERFAVGRKSQKLGVWARRQRARNLLAGCVDGLDRVVIADGDGDELAVLAHDDAARALTHLDRFRDLHLVRIEHGNRIALLVRNIGFSRESGMGREPKKCRRECAAGARIMPFPPLPSLERALCFRLIVAERIQL